MPTQPTIAIRVDAGSTTGVGHLMRCLALAEEVTSRGLEIRLYGSSGGLEWAANQARQRGIQWLPADRDPHAWLDTAHPSHLIIDGYHLPAELGRVARERGIRVATLVDGPYGIEQHADVYVDQNLGAERHSDLPTDATVLTGVQYAIVNDRVRQRRDAPRIPHDPLRILVMFGGTDAYNGTPVLVDCLRATGLPADITAIAPNEATSSALTGLPEIAGQRLTVIGSVDDLPQLAIHHDIVVSASGTSLWELMCLGLPIAAVCVVDNQLVGYEKVLDAEVVWPVGLLDPLRCDGPARQEAIAGLTRLMTDVALRQRLSERGRALVDGAGRVRVVDALLIEA